MNSPGDGSQSPGVGDQATTWEFRRTRTTEGILMNFVVDEVETPSGGRMVRNYLEHPNAVGIIALDDRGRIGVESQYRHPVRHRLLEAPAGLCDQEEESLFATAKRELAEELSLSAQEWSILVDVYSSPGSSTQATRVFLARGLTPTAQHLDAGEFLNVESFSLDELVARCLSGGVTDAKTLAAVLKYQVLRARGQI